MSAAHPPAHLLRALVIAGSTQRRARVADLARAGYDADAVIEALTDVLGEAVARGEDVEPGLAAAEAAAEHGGHPRARAAALRLRAWLATARDARHDDALALCDRAAALLDPAAATDAPLAARVDATRVWPLFSLGRVDDAVAASDRAERALRAIDAGHPALHGLLMNRATALNFAGRYAQALGALDAAEALDGSAAAALDVALLRGLVLGNLGDLDAAAAVLAPLPSAAEAAGRHAVAAMAAHNLGLVELRRGRFFAALRALYAARERLAAAGDAVGATRVGLTLVEGLLGLRRLREAEELLQRLAGALPADALRERAQASFLDGIAQAGIGRPARAEARLREARACFAEAGLPHWAAAADRELALLALERGDAATAAAVARSAAAAADASGEAYDAALARLTLARALGACGDATARDLAVELADLARANAWPRLAYRVEALAGQLAADAGDVAAAAGAFARAIDVLERTERGLLAEDRPSYLDDKGATYHRLTALHLAAGRITAALSVAERGKARALVALREQGGARRAAGSDGEARVAGVLRDRRARVVEARRGATPPDAAELQVLEDDLALRWHRARFGGEPLPDAPHDAGRKRAGPSSGTAIAPVDPRAATVAYAALPGGGLAAFVGRDGAWAGRRLTLGLAEVGALVDRLHRHLAVAEGLGGERLAASAAALRSVLGALWDGLLGPLDLPDGASRLVVAPCAALHRVPFAALWDGRRYLVERASLRMVPTLGLPEPPARGRGAAALGCSLDGALPAAVREAAAVAAIHGVAPVLEDGATLGALLDALARRALVHVAGHAVQRPDAPPLAALALADGDLTALELYDVPIAADLVVLAGCDTAAVAPTGADEPLGMTHALLAAGAASVIAAQWAVHDASSVALMSELHRRLRSGEPREEALAAAQRAAIVAPERAASHPFHWAGVQLVGRGGPLADGSLVESQPTKGGPG